MGTIVRLRSKLSDSNLRNVVMGVDNTDPANPKVVTQPFFDDSSNEDSFETVLAQLWDWTELSSEQSIFRNLLTNKYISSKNGLDKPVALVSSYNFDSPESEVTWYLSRQGYNNDQEQTDNAPRPFIIYDNDKKKGALNINDNYGTLDGTPIIVSKKNDKKHKIESWYIDPPRVQVNKLKRGKITISVESISRDGNQDTFTVWTKMAGEGKSSKRIVGSGSVEFEDDDITPTFYISSSRLIGGVQTENSVNSLEFFQTHLTATGQEIELKFFYGDPDPASRIKVTIEEAR